MRSRHARRSGAGVGPRPLALEDAGAFAVVVEAVPDSVAEAVTARLKIPRSVLEPGRHCDGQVLVSYDMFGFFDAYVPSFVKQYANLGELVMSAAKDYATTCAKATINIFRAKAAPRSGAKSR